MRFFAWPYLGFHLHFINRQNLFHLPKQWRSGSALKTGRQEVPGSIPSRACRTSRPEFPGVFSETRVNTG